MHRYFRAFALGALALAALGGQAQARTICTIIADAGTGRILLSEGDCQSRVTPASTFKVALAIMGYDHGFLTDEATPTLPFREGYPDWIEAWKQPTGPATWMANSVVWYSQQIAQSLGAERLSRYATAFGYGNGDFAGDPGKENGLERSWISSSLKVSPAEQVAFLRRLVTGALPVSPDAIAKTMRIVERAGTSDGWTIGGKTGSAYPRRADGSFDRARGWGWFVGWADKGDRTIVFARLDQDETRTQGSGGIRARAALLEAWPSLMQRSAD